MINIFSDTAEFLLLSLKRLHEEGVSTSQLIEAAVKGRFGGDDKRTVLAARNLILSGFNTNNRLSHLIAQLSKQLSQEGKSSGESQVLDEVINILQSGFVFNRLTGDAIEHLRKILLTPLEYTTLREKLRVCELQCKGCNKELFAEQLVSLSVENDRNGLRDVRVYCQRCMLPKTLACSNAGCHGHVHAAVSIRNFLRKKRLCEACKQPKQAEGCAPIIEPPPFPPPPLTWRAITLPRRIETPPTLLDETVTENER